MATLFLIEFAHLQLIYDIYKTVQTNRMVPQTAEIAAVQMAVA